MHQNEVDRIIEGIFSDYEQGKTLTGEQTRDCVLAAVSAIIASLSKRSTAGESSGASVISSYDYRVVSLGLERAMVYNLSALLQHTIGMEIQESEK